MISISISPPLRRFTGGRSRVEINSDLKTVREALAALWTLYPALRDRVTNQLGEVRLVLRIFVGNENIGFTGGPLHTCKRRQRNSHRAL